MQHPILTRLDALLSEGMKFGLEAVFPLEATLSGYRMGYCDINWMFSNWVISGSIELDTNWEDIPVIWLNLEGDGTPQIGRSGLGIVVTSFTLSQPHAQKNNQLKLWAAGSTDQLEQSFVQMPMSHIDIALRGNNENLRTALAAVKRDGRFKKNDGALDWAIKALDSDSGQLITILSRQQRTVVTSTSKDGVDAMCDCLRRRLDDTSSDQTFTVIFGTSIVTATRNTAKEWWISSVQQYRPTRRENLQGMVWIRTGPKADTIDEGGFGLLLGSPSNDQSISLGRLGATFRKSKPGDPLDPVREILAGISGQGGARRPGGMRFPSGPLFNLAGTLAGKKEHTIWFIRQGDDD